MRSIDEQFGIVRGIRNFDKMEAEAASQKNEDEINTEEIPIENDPNIDQIEAELSRYIDPVRTTVEHLNDEIDGLENVLTGESSDEFDIIEKRDNEALTGNVYCVTGCTTQPHEEQKEPDKLMEMLLRNPDEVGGILGAFPGNTITAGMIMSTESKKAAEGNAKYRQTKEVALGLLEQIGDSDILSEGQKISLLTEIYRTSIELLKERWGVNL